MSNIFYGYSRDDTMSEFNTHAHFLCKIIHTFYSFYLPPKIYTRSTFSFLATNNINAKITMISLLCVV